MREIIDLDVNRHPEPECFSTASGAFLWSDDTTPRTDRPVRFFPALVFWKKLAQPHRRFSCVK